MGESGRDHRSGILRVDTGQYIYANIFFYRSLYV